MTIFHYEGFETIGTTSSTGADLEARIPKYPGYTFQEVSGGHTDLIALVDDFATEGLALRLPLGLSSRGSYLRSEWPAAFKASTNSGHPVMAAGFRWYNSATSPAYARSIWNFMTSATGLGPTLGVASNGVDLTWTDNTGAVTISDVLSVDEWHFIEIEYKPVPSSNGGYVKLYVDGTEVYHGAGRSLVSFTFFSSYGTRLGVSTANNEVGGNRPAIDDWYNMSIDGVTHTTPLGDIRVKLLTPTSDATPNDWAPSAGADNFAMIDEQSWNETDYVEGDVTGDDDHYGLETLSGTDAVHALQIDVVCKATNGTPTLHVGFDDGTADEESGGVIGTASTKVVRKLFPLDPSGSAWNETSVNDVEATQRMTE